EPTSVEPVKETLRSRGSDIRVFENSPGERVVTTLRSPGGRPASIISCAAYRLVSGVSAAGLRIVGQPAASAGAIFLSPIANGKFQGVISRQGPTGSSVARIFQPPSGLSWMRPLRRTASSAYHCR